MRYEIKRFEMIEASLLEPHPDAQAYPSDNDDREIIKASVGDNGILQPLIVAERTGKKTFWVFDGLGRLEARRNELLPCLVVECDDPRMFAMTINSAGRKRSTGSRVLCYLMSNRDKVMEASEATDQGQPSRDGRPHKKQSRNEVSEDLKPWTVREMSKRLGVSDKDVTYSMELMTCYQKSVYPSVCVHGKFAPNTPIKESEDYDALEKAFNGVMAGRIPVRRWPAAFAGKVNLKGEGKAPTDFVALGHRTAVSLANVFENWTKIPFNMRGGILDLLHEALEKAPDDVKTIAVELFAVSKKAK